MKRLLLCLTIVILGSLSFSQSNIDKNELLTATKASYNNYSGTYSCETNSALEIRKIGRRLGQDIYIQDTEWHILQPKAYDNPLNRYSVVRIHSNSGLGADVFFIEENAKVDTDRNIKRIISGYIEYAFKASQNEADTLAELVCWYNTNHYQDHLYFNNKFTAEINQITTNTIGLSDKYKDWPENTAIVIPLTIKTIKESKSKIPDITDDQLASITNSESKNINAPAGSKQHSNFDLLGLINNIINKLGSTCKFLFFPLLIITITYLFIRYALPLIRVLNLKTLTLKISKTHLPHIEIHADNVVADKKEKVLKLRGPNNNGHWLGERKNSKWIPNPEYRPKKCNPQHLTWGEIFSKYGIDGIDFKNGFVDFSPVTTYLKDLNEFSPFRTINYHNGITEIAIEKNMTFKDVQKMLGSVTHHEMENCSTLQFVPKIIHENIPHSGGIQIIRYKILYSSFTITY